MPTYTSQYPTHDANHVKATTEYQAGWEAYRATNPATSLIGDTQNNTWACEAAVTTNQRFHIDLGSTIIRRIYYENFHDNGGVTDRGVKNFTFWGSNTEASFLQLTYGTDTGWVELTCSQNTFDEHVGADEADPKYIVVTNSTAYQYYALKCADNYNGYLMGIRRVELQTEDGYTPDNAIFFGMDF